MGEPFWTSASLALSEGAIARSLDTRSDNRRAAGVRQSCRLRRGDDRFTRFLQRHRRQRNAPAGLDRARDREPRFPARTGRSMRAGRRKVRLSPLARDPAVPAGRLGASARDDAGHLGGGRGRLCPTSSERANSGSEHLTRPQFLASLLNSAQRSVAVGGTSGKSTVTGMIGWILHACHRQPTVMNGAVMKNFVTPSAPFASALVGDPELFVSEVDESDGSIALYRPEIAVLTNISLDHKEMDELRQLFAGFLGAARKAVLNLDDPEVRGARRGAAEGQAGRLRLRQPGCRHSGQGPAAASKRSQLRGQAGGERNAVRLAVPGRHNASNALAAIAATSRRLGSGSPMRPPRLAASKACGGGSRRSAKPAA